MNGNEFPDLVPMTNACPGRLPFIFQVLRSDADGRIRIKNVIFAYFEFPFEEYVPHQSRASAHADTGANDAIGADVRIGGDFSFDLLWQWSGSPSAFYASCGSGSFTSAEDGLSASLHMTTASATTVPSTVAMPCILATVAFRRVSVISMRS